ncbi:MAG: hypothetical protein IPO01_10850 [Chitinophagaceae bacterium]|nr:hypothetical protein [Chitinophagaceae bacterium]
MTKRGVVSLIFNPHKKRSYILGKEKFNYFIEKYYPNKKLVLRKPSFYSFLIPFPNVEFITEKSKISWDN